jgi:glyoxylate reductase
VSRPRVFVTRELPGDLAPLRAEADVKVWPGSDPPPAEALRREAAKSHALLTLITDRIDAALLDQAPDLRVVSNLAVGYDNIDVTACTEHGVLVCNTPGVLTETVADLTFALMLAFARRIPEGERVVREGRWPVWHPSFLLGRDVHGATLGIVGLDAIGLAVAKRARGFGMTILYTSRHRKPDAERELGVQWRELPELLRESDYVSLNVALTPETKGLIGTKELAAMKPTGILVNTARGGVIDQDALVKALRERRIGGAALDVFAVEPIPAGDPLLQLDNVLVAPHVGSASVATRARMTALAVDNILAVLRGEEPPCCVNPEALL